jgi:hypothetical protein
VCYLTLLSTSADTDLSQSDTPLLRFSAAMPGVPEERYLQFAHRWHVRSASGCSCQLRHLTSPTEDFGFSEPEDWFPEDAGDVEATRSFAVLMRELASRGERVDCVDASAHGQPGPVPLAGDIEVDLSEVPAASFRFFENWRFSFVAR